MIEMIIAAIIVIMLTMISITVIMLTITTTIMVVRMRSSIREINHASSMKKTRRPKTTMAQINNAFPGSKTNVCLKTYEMKDAHDKHIERNGKYY